jgi:hypothetical protein
MTGSLREGDDKVNAKDGLDDTATAIATPAIAARTPLGMRRGIMVSSKLASDVRLIAFAAHRALT